MNVFTGDTATTRKSSSSEDGGTPPMNDSKDIISPQEAPSTSARPSHIEHTTATWICWAAALYCSSFRRQRPSGEAIRSSCTTPASAPSSTTCCAGRTLHSRSAGSGSACAPGPHRVLAGQLPALRRRHYAPPEALQKQRHLRGPWATSHAPPEQERQRRCTHSSDTAVLKKASLVFMSASHTTAPCLRAQPAAIWG